MQSQHNVVSRHALVKDDTMQLASGRVGCRAANIIDIIGNIDYINLSTQKLMQQFVVLF